ncbi:hypothetical protein GCM10017687_74390 [Streptomyces echinatus]|uniref:hypothetical protein n=1 Tax=Streptomyces echinatus TaxID=67293 RepID=UPI0033754650
MQKAATIQVDGGWRRHVTSPATPTHSATPTGSATPTHTATATPTATGGTGQTDFTGKEVQVPYACRTPIGDKNATSPVQIDAKKSGGSYALTVRFKKSVMDSPAEIRRTP